MREHLHRPHVMIRRGHTPATLAQVGQKRLDATGRDVRDPLELAAGDDRSHPLGRGGDVVLGAASVPEVLLVVVDVLLERTLVVLVKRILQPGRCTFRLPHQLVQHCLRSRFVSRQRHARVPALGVAVSAPPFS